MAANSSAVVESIETRISGNSIDHAENRYYQEHQLLSRSVDIPHLRRCCFSLAPCSYAGMLPLFHVKPVPMWQRWIWAMIGLVILGPIVAILLGMVLSVFEMP